MLLIPLIPNNMSKKNPLHPKTKEPVFCIIDVFGKVKQETDLNKWKLWMSQNESKRIIQRTDLPKDNAYVITTFVGVDNEVTEHAKPLVFESKIVGGELDGRCQRTENVEYANTAHELLILDVTDSYKSDEAVMPNKSAIETPHTTHETMKTQEQPQTQTSIQESGTVSLQKTMQIELEIKRARLNEMAAELPMLEQDVIRLEEAFRVLVHGVQTTQPPIRVPHQDNVKKIGYNSDYYQKNKEQINAAANWKMTETVVFNVVRVLQQHGQMKANRIYDTLIAENRIPPIPTEYPARSFALKLSHVSSLWNKYLHYDKDDTKEWSVLAGAPITMHDRIQESKNAANSTMNGRVFSSHKTEEVAQ